MIGYGCEDGQQLLQTRGHETESFTDRGTIESEGEKEKEKRGRTDKTQRQRSRKKEKPRKNTDK